MPYVIRDAQGAVMALSAHPVEGAEEMVANHPDLQAFIARSIGEAPFMASDFALIRVVEDLVEVLLRKGVIALSDLPAAAQDKMSQRRALRGWLSGVAGLMDDGEGKVI